MGERWIPVALLVAAGIAIPLTHGAPREAATVTFVALCIPVWRSELAPWFVYSSIGLAALLGVVWYASDFEVRAWAFGIWAAFVVIPLFAEAVTEEVEERNVPTSNARRLVRAVAWAIAGGRGGYGSDDC
jgi:hypothetical protein